MTGGVKRLAIEVVAMTGLAMASIAPAALAEDVATDRIPIMIVGLAHLVAHNDIHNSNFDDPLSPKRQAQIIAAMDRLAPFHPTKVLVEGKYGDPIWAERYQQYLNGTLTLGANEIYQFGFRLAAMAHDKSIYPIDTVQDFPFDFDGVTAAAKKYGQTKILSDGDASEAQRLQAEDSLVKSGTILQLLAYLNRPDIIDNNVPWYMYIDRIGADKDYPGADLVSSWYARNLHMFANIIRIIDSPDDRVVIFVGAGHINQLRDYVRHSPDLQLVDPELYLDPGVTNN